MQIVETFFLLGGPGTNYQAIDSNPRQFIDHFEAIERGLVLDQCQAQVIYGIQVWVGVHPELRFEVHEHIYPG